MCGVPVTGQNAELSPHFVQITLFVVLLVAAVEEIAECAAPVTEQKGAFVNPHTAHVSDSDGLYCGKVLVVIILVVEVEEDKDVAVADCLPRLRDESVVMLCGLEFSNKLLVRCRLCNASVLVLLTLLADACELTTVHVLSLLFTVTKGLLSLSSCCC